MSGSESSVRSSGGIRLALTPNCRRAIVALLALAFSCNSDVAQKHEEQIFDDYALALSVARDLVVCDDADCDYQGAVGACLDGPTKDGNIQLFVRRQADIAKVKQDFYQAYEDLLRQESEDKLRPPVKPTLRFVVLGNVVFLGHEQVEMRAAPRDRPAPIGSSISHPNGGPGTLGCRVREKGRHDNVYLLSNWHVLTPNENSGVGDVILQPARRHGGRLKKDGVGKVAAVRKVHFDRPDNELDAAIAETRKACVGTETSGNKSYRPSVEPTTSRVGDRVLKHGAETERTEGTIRCKKAVVCVCYASGPARFVDQIVVEGKKNDSFCYFGDSGSLIVEEKAKSPVGLLFAVNAQIENAGTAEVIDSACIANPIETVLKGFPGLELEIDASDPGEYPESDCRFRNP